jgi:hypothetical protein
MKERANLTGSERNFPISSNIELNILQKSSFEVAVSTDNG